MKKTAILVSVMIMVLSVTFCFTGCSNGDTEATEATATPIATVAPTATPTKAPTTPTATQSTTPTATVPTATIPTQPATFSAQLATGTATSPTAATSESGEEATASPYASSAVGEPDDNGCYTLTGTVTGFGGTTVVMMLGDGNEYEFNYSGTDISYDDLYEGATITVVADGDPTGAGVPNALTLSVE